MDEYEQESGFPPRETRMRMVVQAMMRGEGLSEREILIRNISRHGIGARCRQEPPSPGDQVTINIGQLPEISGSVRWVRGDQFGLRLDRELDMTMFEEPTKAEPPRPSIDLGF